MDDESRLGSAPIKLLKTEIGVYCKQCASMIQKYLMAVQLAHENERKP